MKRHGEKKKKEKHPKRQQSRSRGATEKEMQNEKSDSRGFARALGSSHLLFLCTSMQASPAPNAQKPGSV